MRNHRSRERRKGIPFYIPLIIACTIVIGSIFLIRWLITKDDTGVANNTPVAYFTLPSGSARVIFSDGLGYRVDPSNDSVNLNVGEGVETMGNTNLEMTLQDGTIVRIGENSVLKIQEFRNLNNRKKVGLSLEKGNIWVITSKDTVFEQFDVGLDRSKLSNIQGAFAVERTDSSNIYRGIQGSGTVRIEKENEDPLLSQNISLGQQITINEEVVKALEEKKSVELLALIDSDFRNSTWYSYNIKRDNGDITPIQNGNDNQPVSAGNNNSTEEQPTTNQNSSTSVSTNNNISIKITAPTQNSTISDAVVMIHGTVKGNVSKIMVDDYVLQKYTPGSSTWQYFASIEADNLVRGKNSLVVYALDASGNRSAPANVTFTYDPTQTVKDLSTPTITSPTNEKEYVTTDNKIIIGGTVDKNADKVMVNDYLLQRYVKGSGVWQYYAYEEYETLAPGANVYTVYAIDKNGKKSKSATFTINYTKKTGTGSSL